MIVTAKRVYSTVARKRAQGEEEEESVGERRSVCVKVASLRWGRKPWAKM